MDETMEPTGPWPGGPLLAAPGCTALRAARERGGGPLRLSLDLGRSEEAVEAHAGYWCWRGGRYPYPAPARERAVLHLEGGDFVPVARFGRSLHQLVATEWGAPTFEIDGVKMLPTARVSPWEDAARKVALVRPRGARILDTCGGLGYFAAWCLREGAAEVLSWEPSAEVHWLRGLNPWSPGSAWERATPGAAPPAPGRLRLVQADAFEAVRGCADAAFDAILHDPPRFSLAGELYSQAFYDQLARVLRRGGRMFHYTGAPNSRSRGRDLAREVATRLAKAGLRARPEGDGVLAVRA